MKDNRKKIVQLRDMSLSVGKVHHGPNAVMENKFMELKKRDKKLYLKREKVLKEGKMKSEKPNPKAWC